MDTCKRYVKLTATWMCNIHAVFHFKQALLFRARFCIRYHPLRAHQAVSGGLGERNDPAEWDALVTRRLRRRVPNASQDRRRRKAQPSYPACDPTPCGQQLRRSGPGKFRVASMFVPPRQQWQPRPDPARPVAGARLHAAATPASPQSGSKRRDAPL